jgi:hypothetical protein
MSGAPAFARFCSEVDAQWRREIRQKAKASRRDKADHKLRYAVSGHKESPSEPVVTLDGKKNKEVRVSKEKFRRHPLRLIRR